MKTFKEYTVLLLILLSGTEQGNAQSMEGECDSPQYLELGKTGTINCNFYEFYAVLWYTRTDFENGIPALSYQRLVKSGAGYDSSEFDVHSNGSLIINHVLLKHDDVFTVAYIPPKDADYNFIDVRVIVLVYPDPSYPVIDGCGRQEVCVLKTQYTGILTCTVKGIRPRVQLRWKTFHDNEATLISFTNQTNLVDNGDTFDVTIVSQYQVTDKSRDGLAVECEVVAANGNLFKLKTTTFLHFVEGSFHPTEEAHVPMTPIILTTLVVTVIVAFVVAVVVSVAMNKTDRVRWTNRMKTEDEEEMETSPVLSTENVDNLPELKKKFLKEIKEKYKNLYDAVQPIPFMKDILYCVDKVFVESGIEFLESPESVGRRGKWKKMEKSHKNFFSDLRVKSSRRILEGEPGFGKSAVTLQFAYDWCNPKPSSALKDVEILILLRLRQLGGTPSIYQAIKRFILPKDTTLSERAIERILHCCSSVVVILDGFDEYPDRGSSPFTDVMKIIEREMFQDFEVVTTTRSSFLPPKYPPLTKRIRLVGFDEKTRRNYIRKAVVGDDEDRVKKIEKCLQDNPIFSELCHVPLLFVIFAHMTYERKQFRKLNSVTSFFRYMISCFHSHMRNKMKDENVSKYKLFETDHRDLDKVAFEALSGDSQKIVWKKDELCQQLKQEFYDQYIGIGILVEEEVIDIIDDPGTPITEHVQYKTEVRFHHKLFCEWYAAHYLSDYIQQNPNIDLNEYLRHLDPFDVQYLYRFSCGLNSNSSEKIVDYLKNIDGGDQFTILCILEQTGKIDNIKETIRQLCSEGVVISGHDSLLLQRSSMQLLEIAARNNIPVNYVNIDDCLESVDLSTAAIRTTSGPVLSTSAIRTTSGPAVTTAAIRTTSGPALSSAATRNTSDPAPSAAAIRTTSSPALSKAAIRITSGLALTSMIPVKQLDVCLQTREITEDEYIDILEFSSMCPSLRGLWLRTSAPPRSFKVGPALAILYSRNVTVSYLGVFKESPRHILNLLTGRWEREKDGVECTEEDVEQMNLDWDKIQEQVHDASKEDCKHAVEGFRETLRRLAEKRKK